MPPSFRFYLENREWSRLVADHKKWLRAFKPPGEIARFLYQVGQGGRDAAQERTHQMTGALSQSHRVIFGVRGVTQFGAPEAVIYVEALRNPLHGLPTTEYAEVEEARGGSHSFYELVVVHDAESIIEHEVESVFGRFF